MVPIGELKDHPRNYQRHPPDEIEHLVASIRQHGVYRNVVVARENTILAGHGVVAAMRTMGRAAVPVHRVDVDPSEPRALKLLAGDNLIVHLAEVDDRELTDLLRELKELDPEGLLGTGYDDMMLANLVMVTRPMSEVQSIDEAAQWVGMPGYDEAGEDPMRVTVNFRSLDDRHAFAERLGIGLPDDDRSIWWPKKPRDDLRSVRFVDGKGQAEAIT